MVFVLGVETSFPYGNSVVACPLHQRAGKFKLAAGARLARASAASETAVLLLDDPAMAEG
jgi:hypothetical protein